MKMMWRKKVLVGIFSGIFLFGSSGCALFSSLKIESTHGADAIVTGNTLSTDMLKVTPAPKPKESQEPEMIRPDLSVMDAGSAKELMGRCIIVSIFLQDPKSKFTEAEKSEELVWLDDACGYLENQAKVYGQSLTMIQGTKDLVFDYKTKNNFSTVVPETIPNSAYDILERLGAEKLCTDLTKKYSADNVAFLIFVNKDGRSYADWADKDYGGIYYYDNAVIFSTQDGFPECAATVAHELLHLFGAYDLYFTDNPEDERIELAMEYFPDDIMRCAYSVLEENVIGDLDAYLLGWTDSVDIRDAYFLLYLEF